MHNLPSGYFWPDTGLWGLAVVLLAPESCGPGCCGRGLCCCPPGEVDGAEPWGLCASKFCMGGHKAAPAQGAVLAVMTPPCERVSRGQVTCRQSSWTHPPDCGFGLASCPWNFKLEGGFDGPRCSGSNRRWKTTPPPPTLHLCQRLSQPNSQDNFFVICGKRVNNLEELY